MSEVLIITKSPKMKMKHWADQFSEFLDALDKISPVNMEYDPSTPKSLSGVRMGDHGEIRIIWRENLFGKEYYLSATKKKREPWQTEDWYFIDSMPSDNNSMHKIRRCQYRPDGKMCETGTSPIATKIFLKDRRRKAPLFQVKMLVGDNKLYREIKQPYDEKFEICEGNIVRNFHPSKSWDMPKWKNDEPLPKPPVKLHRPEYLEAKRQYMLDYPENLKELQKMGYFRDDDFPEWEERWQKARPQRDRAKGRDVYITIVPVAYDELRAHKAIAGYKWYSQYKLLNKKIFKVEHTATYKFEHFEPYWITSWESGKKQEIRMATKPRIYWQSEIVIHRKKGQEIRILNEYEPWYCSLTGKEGLYDQEEVYTMDESPIEEDDESDVLIKTYSKDDYEIRKLINIMARQQTLPPIKHAIWWVKNNIWIAGQGKKRYIGYYRLNDPLVRQARPIYISELAKIVGCHRSTMSKYIKKIDSIEKIMQFLCQSRHIDRHEFENWLQYSEGEGLDNIGKKNLLIFFK